MTKNFTVISFNILLLKSLVFINPRLLIYNM